MKKQAPAAARNRDPIAQVLAAELPKEGSVLEIASGTGEHAVHFAARFANLHWQPSDPDEDAFASIVAWTADSGLPNIAPPVKLDATLRQWPITNADAILCINMVHISPIEASEGLVSAAGRILPQGAPLILYGPWREEGIETAPSNLEFELWLKAKDVRFGLRDTAWMDGLSASHGLTCSNRIAMPANNIMLVYRKD